MLKEFFTMLLAIIWLIAAILVSVAGGLSLLAGGGEIILKASILLVGLCLLSGWFVFSERAF